MKHLRMLVPALTALSLALVGCVEDAGPRASDLGDRTNGCDPASSPVEPGLTPHFREWLAQSEYANDDFARDDLEGGSFGGMADDLDCAGRQPVIFVHGNSDQALGGLTGGWTKSVEHFEAAGYSSAELYGTSWGTADPLDSGSTYHSRANLMQVRRFIEAVLEYTGAEKVDVIGHSMGVTLSRKAIAGGWAHDYLGGGDYDVGPALTDSVDTFVGIAGGNLGLASCYSTPGVPTCAPTNGLYPGYLWWGFVVNRSEFLEDLYDNRGTEGEHRFSIWSTYDQIVGGGCLVWGQNTCRLPEQTGEKSYSSYGYGHFGVRDKTAEVQLSMVADHVVP